MKKLRLLWSYSSGVRLAALILLVVSCYALYSAVTVARSLKSAYDNYAFVRDTDLHAAYSFVNWNQPRSDEEFEQQEQFFAEGGYGTLFRSLEKCPAVESLGTFSIYQHPLYSMEYYDPEDPDSIPDLPIGSEEQGDDASSNPQYIYESGIYIHTINPGVFDFFPNLKKVFTFENPHGVYIIGDDAFPGVRTGDTLRCYTPTKKEQDLLDPTLIHNYPGFVAEFPVAGRYGTPFMMPNEYGVGSSEGTIEGLVREIDAPMLLMLDTEENREWLASMGFEMHHYWFSFYIRYTEDAAKEEIAEVEDQFNALGGLSPLEGVQINLETNLKTAFLELLPGAILRTAIMLLCYASLILLTVRKKQKEIAVSYICGATREKNAFLLTALLFLVTVLAGILNLLYLYLAPSIEPTTFGRKLRLNPSFLHFVRNWLPTCTVLVYFVLMLLLGWILVKASMARRSPIDYFKEANK